MAWRASRAVASIRSEGEDAVGGLELPGVFCCPGFWDCCIMCRLLLENPGVPPREEVRASAKKRDQLLSNSLRTQTKWRAGPSTESKTPLSTVCGNKRRLYPRPLEHVSLHHLPWVSHCIFHPF